jgi:hypothetical protein
MQIISDQGEEKMLHRNCTFSDNSWQKWTTKPMKLSLDL